MPKADYVFDSLGIVESDSDQMGGCCAQFAAGADMQEGVSGRKKIDTTYENFSEDMVESPRSDRDVKSAPYPMDLGRYPHRRY